MSLSYDPCHLLLEEGTHVVGEGVLYGACQWFHFGINQSRGKDLNQGFNFDIFKWHGDQYFDKHNPGPF